MLAHKIHYFKPEKPGELWVPMWDRGKSKAARLALLWERASQM